MTNHYHEPLTISRLAHACGVGVETIRYYQRIGLLEEPPKPDHGYRLYPPETVDRLAFITRAKQLGFSLKEIAELLQLGPADCQTTRQLARAKQQTIRNKIEDLQAMSQILEQLIERCESDTGSQCPILQALSRPDNS